MGGKGSLRDRERGDGRRGLSSKRVSQTAGTEGVGPKAYHPSFDDDQLMKL